MLISGLADGGGQSGELQDCYVNHQTGVRHASRSLWATDEGNRKLEHRQQRGFNLLGMVCILYFCNCHQYYLSPRLPADGAAGSRQELRPAARL